MEKMLTSLKEINLSHNEKIVAVSVGSGIVLAWLWRRRKRNYPSPWAKGPAEIVVKNYEKDKVYMFQLPPCSHIVSGSPYCLKMETYLRLKKIPYESQTTMSKWSKYGLLPFIELNGEHFADSGIIIKELTERLNLPDENLTAEERGHLHAASRMMENHTNWSYTYYRYVDAIDESLQEFPFVSSFFRMILRRTVPKNAKFAAEKHGIGRHTKEEIYELGFQDLQALSDMLGDKAFFAGKQITTVDCTMFANLAQIVYIPLKDYPHLLYMQDHCSNLIKYVERVKLQLWPDWDERCAH